MIQVSDEECRAMSAQIRKSLDEAEREIAAMNAAEERNAEKVMRERFAARAAQEAEREPSIARTALLLFVAIVAIGVWLLLGAVNRSEGAEAEKPVTAIQSENARSLEELKVSAASNVEALKSIRAIATEYREQIDYGCAGMGLYAVGAPKGEYLALRLSRFCHEHYPDPVKQVIVTVHYGPSNVAEVQTHADKPHRAIRVYVEAESDHEALILTERALDALAGKPQRTLEPEQGRGVPE